LDRADRSAGWSNLSNASWPAARNRAAAIRTPDGASARNSETVQLCDSPPLLWPDGIRPPPAAHQQMAASATWRHACMQPGLMKKANQFEVDVPRPWSTSSSRTVLAAWGCVTWVG
jgi:hypothetical protein